MVTPIRDGLASIAETLPDKLRERIEQPPFPELWLTAFETRLRRGERDAGRLYPELLRMVNGDRTVLILAVWRELGVADESEARSLIGLAKSVEGIDGAAATQMFRQHLEAQGWTCLPPGTDASRGNGAD